jgi:hypothetical protein
MSGRLIFSGAALPRHASHPDQRQVAEQDAIALRPRSETPPVISD